MEGLKESRKGRFFVVYGANNLGKSEQVKRLATRLIMEKKQVLMVKYAIYDLEPTGPKINSILRNPDDPDRGLSEFEFQKIYAQNRRDFQQTIINLLNAGVHIVAEDYTGTGLSWGMTRDVPLEQLEEINADLLVPDVAILLDGERFTTLVEKKHRNESDADAIWEKNREMHRILAAKYDWQVVQANQNMEDVHEDIMKVIAQTVPELGIQNSYNTTHETTPEQIQQL
jgi:thymidylate kinase